MTDLVAIESKFKVVWMSITGIQDQRSESVVIEFQSLDGQFLFHFLCN